MSCLSNAFLNKNTQVLSAKSIQVSHIKVLFMQNAPCQNNLLLYTMLLDHCY